jgi:DivIVA domain-containing protein
MRRKKEQQASGSEVGRVTPADVQQVEFRLAFRGYNERDVDAFLDRVTEDLAAYLEELERLRGGAGASQVPGDADQVLARAREEAAAIVRRAEEEAAAIRASAAAPAGDAADLRAAVAPFLNREREFLQSLGSLVQGHAEEIKQMVLALRARAEAAQAAPQMPDEPREEAPPTFEPATAAEIAERLGEREPDELAPQPPAEVGTVVVEPATEPAYSSEGAPAGERRERSLRELFWGEE